MSNDVAVEFGKFFGRNPVFPVFSRARNLGGKPGKIIGFDFEAENIAGATVSGVPVTRDLDGIVLF